MKKCPKCNAYGESETTRFCRNCGAELFEESRYKEKNVATINKSSPQINWLLLFIIGIFATIFIVVLLVVFIIMKGA